MGDGQPGLSFLDWSGVRLAYRHRRGSGPTLLFLPGYASDMDGTKALALNAFAERRGTAIMRFDYSGTGSSSGRFEDGTLAAWLDQGLAILDGLIEGRVILIGSSMGGWIALHMALRRPGRVAGVVGIAAAPDFTEWGFEPGQKEQLLRSGRLERPNPYGGVPQLTTVGFWKSGQELRLLDEPIALPCPVRLVHGDADAEVPIEVAFRLMRQLRSADVQLTVLKGGGHRLSEPHEIEAIVRTVASLLEPVP